MTENSNKTLGDFINFIDYLNSLNDFSVVVIKKNHDKVICGIVKEGWMDNPSELNISKDSLCKDLRDALIDKFGEEISPAYTHSFAGNYEYLMKLKNVIIKFPNNPEYQKWIYNQVNEEHQTNHKR
ncbi:MAG: hypothetical protein IJK67_03735 [Bacilli bacterium]|nr:hypothetical protein [Bacilli bacterium]